MTSFNYLLLGRERLESKHALRNTSTKRSAGTMDNEPTAQLSSLVADYTSSSDSDSDSGLAPDQPQSGKTDAASSHAPRRSAPVHTSVKPRLEENAHVRREEPIPAAHPPTGLPAELERELRRGGVTAAPPMLTVDASAAATGAPLEQAPARPARRGHARGITKAARRTHHITALAATARANQSESQPGPRPH